MADWREGSLTEGTNTYLCEREGKGAALSTIRSIRWAIRPFAEAMDKLSPSPLLLTQRDVKDYLYGKDGLSRRPTQRGRRMSGKSFNLAQGYISAFLVWAAGEDLVHPGLHLACETVPAATTLQPRVTSDQMDEALRDCDDPLDYIIMATAVETLGRASELKLVQYKHIDLHGGAIQWWNQKKKRWDTKAIGARYAKELTAWTEEYERVVGRPHDGSWYLLPSRYIKPDTREVRYRPDRPYATMELIAHRHLDRFFPDSTEGVGMHVFRRSGARAMFDHLAKGGYSSALKYVSAQLDHKSTGITEDYLGLDADKLAIQGLIRSGQADWRGGGLATVTPLRAV